MKDRAHYEVSNFNDLQLLYSILREKHPQNQIDVVTTTSQPNVYKVTVTKSSFTGDPNVPIDLNIEVVYGDTDSVFLRFKFNRDDFEQNRKDTFRLAALCGDKLTDEVFNRPPIVLEFEKVFQPFVLLTKKRYIAKKFENVKDPFELKGIDAKGIALTRRDYCTLVKKCYRTIIDTIMGSGQDLVQRSIHEFKSYITQIEEYNVQMSDLVVTAQIAKEYSCKLCKKKTEWTIKCSHCKTSNPQKDPNCTKCKRPFACLHSFSLAHINLAQNMLRRNEEIQIGDRISYAFVQSENKKAQKFDLAEDPKYIKEHNLQINRVCYLEQLAKPILALYKIILKDSPDTLEELISYVNSKLVTFGGKALRASDFKLED
jgi:DNA polymerase delta subunit 1